MDLLLLILIAVVAIAVVTVLAERLRVAGALLLVALGIGISLLPFVDFPEVDPEWILVGVLPPLLYAAAVRLPAIEFRRDFTPIAGLAILLVVVTALALGWFFSLVLPGVGFSLGIALGAILSPTDAVATGIAKKLGISPRVVTLLEGESLLNDATALVLLRTALLAVAAGSFTAGAVIGSFVWGVAVALVIGAVLGCLALRLRAWIRSSPASTAIGFTVPFLAYIPTEHLGGSGLVAAVVAGIVAGQGAQRWFTPEQRLSDELNWKTIELVLEGAIFLVMGLELEQIVGDVVNRHEGLGLPTVVALVSVAIILVVRAGYVALLVWLQSRRARRLQGDGRERLAALDARLTQLEAGGALDAIAADRGRGRPGGRGRGGRDRGGRRERGRGRGARDPHIPPEISPRRIASLRERISRAVADLDYYQSSPLGWKHGTVIVWAGMRGVVTLAAAQTIPHQIESRAELVYIAFLVALVSLLAQGFSLPALVRVLRIDAAAEGDGDSGRERLDEHLRQAAADALADPGLRKRDGSPFSPEIVAQTDRRTTTSLGAPPSEQMLEILELRLVLTEAMRQRLTAIGAGGAFSSGLLRQVMSELDADQLSIELRLRGD